MCFSEAWPHSNTHLFLLVVLPHLLPFMYTFASVCVPKPTLKNKQPFDFCLLGQPSRLTWTRWPYFLTLQLFSLVSFERPQSSTPETMITVTTLWRW